MRVLRWSLLPAHVVHCADRKFHRRRHHQWIDGCDVPTHHALDRLRGQQLCTVVPIALLYWEQALLFGGVVLILLLVRQLQLERYMVDGAVNTSADEVAVGLVGMSAREQPLKEASSCAVVTSRIDE